MTIQQNLAAMKENDPVGYAVKVAEMTEKKEQLQTVQAERARLAQEQQTESQAQMQKFVEQEQIKLAESLPEFSDKTKGEQVRNDIRSYGKKVGFHRRRNYLKSMTLAMYWYYIKQHNTTN